MNSDLIVKTDSLTDTLDRDSISAVVEDFIAKGKNNGYIILDLDCFTKLNEVLGRDMGDDVLVSVVDTLKRALRKDDIIGRIGGDEFLVCLKDIDDKSVVEKIAKHICVLSKHSLSKGVYVSVSLGIVMSCDVISFDDMVSKAEVAMLSVKKNGGNGYVFYSDCIDNEPCRNVVGCNYYSGFSVEKSLIFNYDISKGEFIFPDEFIKYKGMLLWDVMLAKGVCSKSTALRIRTSIENISACSSPTVKYSEVYIKDGKGIWGWYMVAFVLSVPGQFVSVIFTDINNEVTANRNLIKLSEYDQLTGLLNREAFCKTVEDVYSYDAEGMAQGKYALIYFDIQRFKAINDIFGMEEGDRLLTYIADFIMTSIRHNDCGCRIGSDRFILFINIREVLPERIIELIMEAINKFDLPFEITFNAGIYITNDEKLSCEAMIDRAILAQSAVKGSYTNIYGFFNEQIRNDMISEQEIAGLMAMALSEGQFVVYYQPQYNHSTGMLIGAEALVRWNHPEKGLVPPASFIPIFEKNGFITKLDLYVFEEVCKFLKTCIEKGTVIVPVSTNFSRYDIFMIDFVEKLEEIRKKYNIPVKYLRVELTESAVLGNSQRTNEVIDKLHDAGYIVEMDDFGSGYSSLNVLKELELDTIKLDMQFLREDNKSNKGGTILSSVVRMAKWLRIPVIAEGVENISQADFLTSIGCEYIQGFLYSKPLCEEKYMELVNDSFVGSTISQLNLIDSLDALNFWSPKSQETLIFNNYVGGAAIFEFDGENVEVLRVNKKYLQELCMNLTENDLIKSDPMRFFDEKNKKIYFDMLKKAITTGEEQECETMRSITSPCCGVEEMIIRTNARMIGKSDKSFLFYAMIRNITAEKKQLEDILNSERRFKMASEQAKIYYWEYNIRTKEMRPCFRCMRDLGLPPLVRNYPEPLYENGIFPMDTYDMYMDWMLKLEEGVSELEAVIPLTADRIPFTVRYTTEFDENGHPVKAYGSATLIV